MLPTFHPTLAPDFTGNNGRILATVTKAKAFPHGKHYSQAEGFDVLAVEAFGYPTMLIDANGNARLVRPKARQSFNEKHVYVSGKTWHVATPFEQPLSVILHVYEEAVKSVR